MKILHINDKIENEGGVEVYIHQLLELASLYHLEMDLIAVTKKNNEYFITEEKTGKIECIKRIKLKQTLQKLTLGYDIIHVHSISDSFLISLLLSLKPIIRSMHEPRMICPGQGKFWRFTEEICTQPFGYHCLIHAYTKGCCNRHPKRLIKAFKNTSFEINDASKRYAKVIVMSEYMRNEAILAGMPTKNIEINPYFSNVEIKRKSISPSNRLLFIGRLINYKGAQYAIKALDLINKNFNKKFHLDIVGDGFEKEKLINLSHKLNLENHITFYGWKSNKEVEEFIENSFALIFPSIYPEAFGIVGLEAMAKGTPVIGFDVGGVSTWLDSVNGFLIKEKSVQSIFKAVKELSDKEKYSKISLNAIDKFKSNFTHEHHFKILIETYKSAIKFT